MPYVPGVGWVDSAYDEKPQEETSYAGANTTVNTTTLAGIQAASGYRGFRAAEEASNKPYYDANPEIVQQLTSKIDRFEVSRINNGDGTISVRYNDGAVETIPDPNYEGPEKPKKKTTTETSTSDALLQQLLAQQQQAAADAAKAREATRVSAMNAVVARFNQYGLGSLANKIKELAVDGATEATITLALQETPEYQARFSANTDRLKKGLAVLSPADYISVEDSYRQVLRAYGLTQFDNDAYVKQFIANDVSATELSNRVTTAVQRVQNADPAVLKQLTDYYGIGSKDVVAYVLDPNQQFQKIQRQVAAAEIGVAAAKQGLQSNVAVSEQLAAQGVTQAEAQKGYATIADILPTATKLSEIYGATLDTYDQSTAEQEVFNQLASAQRKRQKLTSAELAAFGGSSGLARGGLSTGKTAGQI
jgi:hypothetical protein